MREVIPSEREQQRYRLTLEARADVDAGGTVDHEAVEQWVDSLTSNNSLSRSPVGKGDGA